MIISQIDGVLTGKQPAGFQAYFPAEVDNDDVLTPDRCVELSAAGTVSAARGRGIGQALTQHGLAQAQSAGYRYCLADYRPPCLRSGRRYVVVRSHLSVAGV